MKRMKRMKQMKQMKQMKRIKRMKQINRMKYGQLVNQPKNSHKMHIKDDFPYYILDKDFRVVSITHNLPITPHLKNWTAP